MGSLSTSIAFTAGINATIVVKLWQLLQSHGVIVGGVYPNPFLYAKGKSDKETVELLKECIAEKHGTQAAEVKVAAITMQVVPHRFSPYFVLAGNVQTINGSISFGKQ
eukprot:10339854-Ditylum_brightwellii.AAC.1